MKIAASFSALFALALVACSSSGGSTSSSDPVDPGIEGGSGATQETNGKGDVYPTANQGTKKGNTIKNYKFVGYLDADKADGLKPISLADFYDPTGETYELIHIQASGTWCSVCKAETQATVPLADQIKARKVAWIITIAEGPTPGVPSTQQDLDKWMSTFNAPFTHVLDPGNKNLGPFYDAAALPWNANINAKTMEILSAGVGGTNDGAAILKEIDAALAQVK
ncbi:hypothetical protein AKJ09_04641 [Labilithrix luteola]|uniref:Thioredoxin domain-containing protein n=1 Tax=Labilithrix luteola TaxID=1391654 RepID=A0A0K1PWT5_9BACT|nr:hypothetical protein [Labilithrix luteola]AKU97977.1 hypothetical protein AKJ09_04641 [Labilithrix luteola]